MVSICLVSDLHCHWELELPAADLCLMSGDETYVGMGDLKQMRKFEEWYKRESVKFKYGLHWTFGNHSVGCTKFNISQTHICPEAAKTCHVDELVEIVGLKIWFSPWSPVFGRWAYMLYDGENSELTKKYAEIPEDIDIIVSHSPPYGVLDDIEDQGGLRVGSHSLRKRLEEMVVKPKVLVAGHLHRWDHQDKYMDFLGISCYNVSVTDDSYQLVNKPQVIEI